MNLLAAIILGVCAGAVLIEFLWRRRLRAARKNWRELADETWAEGFHVLAVEIDARADAMSNLLYESWCDPQYGRRSNKTIPEPPSFEVQG